jgi:hypothetical protein
MKQPRQDMQNILFYFSYIYLSFCLFIYLFYVGCAMLGSLKLSN